MICANSCDACAVCTVMLLNARRYTYIEGYFPSRVMSVLYVSIECHQTAIVEEVRSGKLSLPVQLTFLEGL
jgi:hypothetical protein